MSEPMRITLLGTGSADGWPNPWCACASCSWARQTPGAARTQTSVLVDGTLLVDSGGCRGSVADLSRVRTVLFTHAHPDHADPQPLLWRQWVADGELEVAGPPAALDLCRSWAGPGVTWTQLHAGAEVVTASGHRVRALAAEHDAASGPPLLYDISGGDSSGSDSSAGADRVLVAWDTAAPLPGLPAGPAYDLVLLECTTGDGPDLPGHHGLDAFARSLADLRRRGAMAAHSRAVAVHLGHRNPPGTELARRLALLGAEVLPDGTVVGEVRPPPPPGRRVLITGGTRSGKSAEAERRLAAEPAVTYVATSHPRPDDGDWSARVAAHRARRPAHWHTVETGDVAELLRGAGPEDAVLVDCVTLWLGGCLDDPGRDQASAELVAAWRSTRARVVLVTNEVGSSVHPATPAGRAFADALGTLNAQLAREADEVWHVVAGQPTRLR